jgi:hypothetical protein
MFDNTNSQYWRGRAWGKPAGESGTERGTGSGRSEITSQASLGGSLPAPPGGPEDAGRYAGTFRTPAHNATLPQARVGKCEIDHGDAEKSPGRP